MDYMQEFAKNQIEEAYSLFRPEFSQKMFPNGMEQAQPLATALAGCLFPGTDCTAGHYQTCFDFYSTYAFTRLMGYDSARAEAACRSKYAGLPEQQYQQAFSACAKALHSAFPTLQEPTKKQGEQV